MSIQKEDVYETPDYETPEEELGEREETFESEHIESIHVNINSALKKFKGRVLNAEGVDFSESLWNRRRQRYGSGKYVLEVVGKENAELENETIEQKFNRLHCEIGELAEMIKNEKDSGSKEVTEIDVKGLADLLDSLKKDRLNAVIPSESTLEKLKKNKDESKKSTVDVDFSTLDSRLKRIEKFVSGNQPTSERVTKTPLAETVEELRLRIETAVNPTVLDGLETKLNTVLNRYQTAEEKRLERSDAAIEEKVNHLSEMMTKWDGTCMSLTGTVNRLRALTNLHEQARDFSTNLQVLINTKNELMKKLESDELSVFEVKKEAMEEIRSLSARVNAVQAALESSK